jgi:hypothetical protein
MSQPMSRKQQLLKRHRRNKRIGLLIALALLIVVGMLVTWWLPLVLAVLGWIAHEAWFADHLFYSPADDYQYSFAAYTQQPKVHLVGEHLRLDEGVMLVDDATLVLALQVKSTWLGRFIDPVVELANLRARGEWPALPEPQWSGARSVPGPTALARTFLPVIRRAGAPGLRAAGLSPSAGDGGRASCRRRGAGGLRFV